ncbi:MAG: DMT family transporter [Thermoleophilia bacterium]|nr:DMT family transporter [Thermoleophilia bacterium]
MIAVALALGASLSWGVSDFVAGLKSRSLSVVAVLAVSQPAGLALVGAALLVWGGQAPTAGEAAWAAAAGAVGLLALASFYRGLAAGAMSVIAPVAATAAAVPLAVGVARGERPTALQAAGVALALVGVVLASREPVEEALGGSRLAAGFGFAVLAAIGFGFFFVAVDVAGDGGAGVLWVTLSLRSASLALVLLAALVVRPRLPRDPGTLAALVAVGALDMSANALFAAASTRGLVSVVSVLASLYPVVLVILARTLLGERIARAQQAGVVLALAGVALISVGG